MAADYSAVDAYESFAPKYDAFTAANDYEQWLGEVLLPELERHGLQKGAVLDAGCGTGRAFGPLLRRGWNVVGTDGSAAMLEEAERKHDHVELHLADLRELPVFGAFNLVLSLNDVFNYLTDDGDLERALTGIRRNMGANGLACFDCNSLASLRSGFAPGISEEQGGLTWKGLGSDPSGAIYEAEISGPGVQTHRHRQRHWPREAVEAAAGDAGIELLAVLGMRETERRRISLVDSSDEEKDGRTIFVARISP